MTSNIFALLLGIMGKGNLFTHGASEGMNFHILIYKQMHYASKPFLLRGLGFRF